MWALSSLSSQVREQRGDAVMERCRGWVRRWEPCSQRRGEGSVRGFLGRQPLEVPTWTLLPQSLGLGEPCSFHEGQLRVSQTLSEARRCQGSRDLPCMVPR